MIDANGVEADQSPSLAALAAALAKAQGLMAGAKKDSVNPHFRSKYADLASIWEACREALSANGLAVIQSPGSAGKDVMVTTLLIHSSGEWIRSRYTMPVAQPGPQGVGSALTYARRYSLAAMVGVAPEDDDGNEAQGARTSQTFAAPAAGKRTAEVKAQLAQRTAKLPEVVDHFAAIRVLGKANGKEGKALSSFVKGCGIAKTKPEEFTAGDVETVRAAFAALPPTDDVPPPGADDAGAPWNQEQQ